MHGGGSPQARRAAEMRQAEAKAATLVLGTQWERCDDPVEALSLLAAEVLAWRDVLQDQVRQLSALAAVDAFGAERPRAVVELYERSLDRAAKLLVAIARLGLDERLVRISEQQAELIVAVIEGTFADLGLDAAQQEAGRGFASGRLRLLDANGNRRESPPQSDQVGDNR